jgi:hypothetical protein
MIVTGPARDGTRLGLIDVSVPRCICWRLVRTTGLLFYWRRDQVKTCRSKDRRYKTVSLASSHALCGTETLGLAKRIYR